MKIVKCEICSKEFKITPQREKNKHHTCSRKCMGLFNQKEKRLTCDFCGKLFHRKESHVKKHKNKYCSSECRYKHKTTTFSGDNNHQFGLLGSLNKSHKSDFSISKYGYLFLIVPNYRTKSKGNKHLLRRPSQKAPD